MQQIGTKHKQASFLEVHLQMKKQNADEWSKWLNRVNSFQPNQHHASIEIESKATYVLSLNLDHEKWWLQLRDENQETKIENGQRLVTMIQTNRAFFEGYFQRKKEIISLQWGETRFIPYAWKMKNNGSQLLSLQQNDHDIKILPTEPLIYLDKKTGHCGFLETNLPQHYVAYLPSIPELCPSMISMISAALPVPQQMQATLKETPIVIPMLHLYGLPSDNNFYLPCAELSFDYGVHKIDLFYPEQFIYYQFENQWFYFERDHQLEEAYMQQLDQLPVQFYHPYVLPAEMQANEFSKELLPWQKSLDTLTQSGWRIEIESDFPVLLDERKAPLR